ncbi:MAG: GTP cyclohydrolase I FolE [Endomicrobium sp.]|nr:GTP cyclohydrolase I FolE [Endomicrobium sp.]
MKKFNFDETKAKKAIKLLLESFGEDLNREGIKRTPERVAEFYKDALSGNNINPSDLVSVSYSSEEHEEIVFIKDISFYSLCEHHLLPFFGKAHIVYIPKKDKLIGVSKLVRLIEIFATRLQLQERFTKQIADSVMDLLKPYGVMVIIEAEHLCITMRGVKKAGSLVITQSMRGKFLKDENIRKEVMSLLGK